MHANPEIDSAPQHGLAFEDRNQPLLQRSRQHGASDHDDVPSCLLRKRGADLATDILDVCQVQASVAIARRSDADQTEVRCLDSATAVDDRIESP